MSNSNCFENILEIKNLSISFGNKEIIKNLSLRINAGERHALMGPNGAGKSTLFLFLAGHPGYTANSGHVLFMGQDLLSLSPDQRACRGLFLNFQTPVEIPGLTTFTMLKEAFHAQQKSKTSTNKDSAIDSIALMKEVRTLAKKVGITEDMLKRPFNVGFSGGEKKRMEFLQMLLLKPKLVLLDELDSGLDVDAVKMVVDVLNNDTDDKMCMLVISHYKRLLQDINIYKVHVLLNGNVAKTGSNELLGILDKEGYATLDLG